MYAFDSLCKFFVNGEINSTFYLYFLYKISSKQTFIDTNVDKTQTE